MSELDDLARTAADSIVNRQCGTVTIHGDYHMRDRMAARIAETFRPLAERAEKIEAMLRRLEWCGHNGGCLTCGGSPSRRTHELGCELAALLSPPQVFPEAKPEPIQLDYDGLCQCEPSIRCPNWASGSTMRCTGEALRAAGFTTREWVKMLPSRRIVLEEVHDMTTEPNPMPRWERTLRHLVKNGYAGRSAVAALAEIDHLRKEMKNDVLLDELAALRKVRDAGHEIWEAAYAFSISGGRAIAYSRLLAAIEPMRQALAAAEPTPTEPKP